MTKTGWEKIKGKGQWDVQVALRGPDSNYGEVLKWFTTSVIRGQMAEIIRVGGLVNNDLKIVVLPSFDGEITQKAKEDFSSKRGWNYNHFCTHVREAVHWLEIPILQIEESLWHKVMSQDSATAAIEGIIARAAKFHDESEKAAKEEEGFMPYPILHTPLYSPAGIDELARHQREGRLWS